LQRIRKRAAAVTNDGIDLLQAMLTYDPALRINPFEACVATAATGRASTERAPTRFPRALAQARAPLLRRAAE